MHRWRYYIENIVRVPNSSYQSIYVVAFDFLCFMDYRNVTLDFSGERD